MLLPSELEALAKAKAVESITLASRYFRREFPIPTVSLNLRGHTAGYADYRAWQIRINIDLLISHPDEQIQITIPHEVAHLVAYHIYGRSITPHGSQWQFIMRSIFGIPADRCHKMQTTPARIVQKYKVYCGCPSHVVTKIILKRIRQGGIYRCRKCNQRLSLTPVEKLSFANLLDSIK